MEIKRIYNDPVDENDIANKRYVDKNVKAVVDKTIADTVESINSGKKPLDNLVVGNITSKNLFDEQWGTLGKRYTNSTSVKFATTNASGQVGIANPIELDRTKSYLIISTNSNYNTNGVYFYDANGIYVSHVYINYRPVPIPSDAYYMTFNLTDVTDISDLANYTWQVEYIDSETDTSTPYSKMKKYGYNSTDSMGKIVVDDISCKNLFDKNDVIENYYLSYENGEPVWDYNMAYMKSYIEVKPNKQYTMSYPTGTIFIIHEYDENKNLLQYTNQNTSDNFFTITTTSNTKYVRLSLGKRAKDFMQFELGVATEYVPYKKYGYNSQESMGSIVVDDISCKNLFNKYGKLNEKFDYTTGDTTLLSDGTIKATSNYAAGNGPGPIIILKPNTDYIVSFDVVSMETTGSCTFRAYGINEDGNIELIFDKYFSSTGHHYQAFNSGKHSKVWLTFNGIFNSDDTSARKYVIYDNVQIEEGTVVSEYTPYKSLGYTSGTNANGSWVKYDDGRMEVQGIRTVPANTQAYTIVFPVSFVDDEYIVSLSYMFQYYFNVVMPLSNKNVNSINVHLFDGAGTELSNEQTIMYEAKGRWK